MPLLADVSPMLRELALIVIPLLFIGPLAVWWAVAAISAVLDPAGFFERGSARLKDCFEGIAISKTPKPDYVSIDYTVSMATWLHRKTERVQLYVPRREAPKLLHRLWWCMICHTLLFRGCAFYWIGATYWFAVERAKLFWK